ncbi:MAG: hypothetical protein ACK5IJ_10575 [Mangrovibacterium sp.]
MNQFHHIAFLCLLLLMSCTGAEVFPPQGYVQVHAQITSDNKDGVMIEKAVASSYLDSIDASTFSIYFYYTRTGVLTTMPEGEQNPTPINAWGEQNIISLYEDTYDFYVANCDPYNYNAQTDKFLPTLNPRRGVKFISKPVGLTLLAEQLLSFDFSKISREKEFYDWNLQTCIINIRARSQDNVNEYNALHSYKIYVGNLLMVNSDNSDDVIPFYPKQITTTGVQGYFPPLLEGESLDVRLEYSEDGSSSKEAVIKGAISKLKAGEETTIIIENFDDDGLGMSVQSPNGETSEIIEIVFS